MRGTNFKRIIEMLVLAGLLLGIAGCRTTESAGTQIDDSWITTKIKTQFAAAPEISSFNISVTTQEGVVTLTGRVKDAASKSEAIKLARQTRGVRRVIDDIKVGSIIPNDSSTQ